MYAKYIIMLNVLICFSCHGQNAEPLKSNNTKILYPYLGADDCYGYADSEGNILIEPQYDKAGFFYNGVAIVRRNGEQEKLINTNNQIVSIPIKYNELRIHPFSDYTFLELTETYHNRWRFWEWKFLPDFSFFGTSARNRLFDTEVMREKRTLYWLEGQQEIQSKKGGLGAGDTYFYLSAVNKHTIQVDDAFYRIGHQKIKRMIKNVKTYKQLERNCYLQKKGGFFRIIDSTGALVTAQKFVPQLEVELEVAGRYFTLTIESYHPTYRKSADLYKDDQENTYVYPDLNKKFPKKINAYPFKDTITATEILKQAQSFVSIPESDRFLLVTNFGREVYVLDTDGNWKNPNESSDKITVVSQVGNILWPTYPDVLGTPLLSEGWRVSSFRIFNKNENEFKISIRNNEESLQGVWDSNTQSWIMLPEYYWIADHPIRNRLVRFQIKKDGKWGIYDLESNTVHIPATYDYINKDGWVRLYENNDLKEFYLEIATRREFRDKHRQK